MVSFDGVTGRRHLQECRCFMFTDALSIDKHLSKNITLPSEVSFSDIIIFTKMETSTIYISEISKHA